MAEMLSAPNAVIAATQTPPRSSESRASEASRPDTDAGTPSAFAQVLKSRSEQAPPVSAKEQTAEAETQATVDAAGATPAPSDPSVLLSLLVAESPAGVNALPMPEAVPASPADPSVLAIAAAASATLAPPPALPGFDSSAPAPTAAPLIQGTASPADPASTQLNPAGALGTMPSPFGGDAKTARNNTDRQGRESPAGRSERQAVAPDKLAVEAAINAESGKSGKLAAGTSTDGSDFHATLDKVANNPASVVIQANAAATPSAQMPALRVEAPLGQAAWRDEMGQKLTWMASNNRQLAEMVLNPPQLGRIEVTLSLNGDQASASFFSPHPGVREALENSMTRLREILADAGVTLGQTHVGANPRDDSRSASPHHDGGTPGRRDGETYAATMGISGGGSTLRITNGRGMVDVFA
jgi:flagellar hook-length control protein FliK